MHWFLYVIGFAAAENNDITLSYFGVFLIICGLFVQFGKKKNTAPVHTGGSSEGDYDGPVKGDIYDSDGNRVNPADITVDCLGYGHSSNGDKWMRDSEDDDWEPYHV